MNFLNFFKPMNPTPTRAELAVINHYDERGAAIQQDKYEEKKWWAMRDYKLRMMNEINNHLYRLNHDAFVYRERPLYGDYNRETANPEYTFDLDNFWTKDYKLKMVYNQEGFYSELKREIINFLDVNCNRGSILSTVKKYHSTCYLEFEFVDNKLEKRYPEMKFKYIIY